MARIIEKVRKFAAWAKATDNSSIPSETKQSPASPPMGEVVTDKLLTGRYASFLKDILKNPDKILEEDSSGKGLDLYREMIYKDLKISSCLQTRKAGVTGKPWHIEPGSEEDADAEIANRIQYDILERLDNFKQDLKGALDCLADGFSPAEVIWNYDERTSLWRPFELKFRDAKYFAFKADTHELMFKPEGSYEYQALPPYKFIVFRNDPQHENPYGNSVLRDIYWYYFFKRPSIKFWAIAIERYGIPTVVAKYPASENDKAKVDDYLEKIKALSNSGSHLVIPDNVIVELLAAARTVGGDQEKFANYLDGKIAERILGQTLTSDIGDMGSRAAAQVHDNVRQDIIEDDAENIQSGFNQLIRWIHDFNFGEPKINYPTFKIDYEPPADNKSNGELLDIATNKIRVSIVKEEAYELLGLRVPVEGEEVIEPSAPMPNPFEQVPPEDKGNPKKSDEKKTFGDVGVMPGQIYYPPPMPKPQVKIYRCSSIVQLQEKFRKKLDTLFASISNDLPDLLRKTPMDYSRLRNVLDDYLRDSYEDTLRGYISETDTLILKQAIYDMAGQLEVTISKANFDMLTKQFMTEHFYEFGKVERVMGMKDTLLTDLLSNYDRLTKSEAGLEDVVAGMMDYFDGTLMPNKLKQIVFTETRSAANWSVIQIGKQMEIKMEAWFLVDPASCQVCQDIAARNPYTLIEAGRMGLPHPGCNDQWVLSKAEEANA